MSVKTLLLLGSLVFPVLGQEECPRGEDLLQNASSEVLREYMDASVKFSLRLFKKLYEKPEVDDIRSQENLIFSPYSVWQALMLTYLASQGVMKEALEDVLGLKDLGKKHASLAFKDLKHFDEVVLGGKESSPGRGLSLLQDQTQGKDQGKQYELNSANRIYIESSMRRFMDQETLRFLHDEIKMLDFGKEPEESRKKINSWVSQITKGKIEELLPAGHVDRSTLMALVNAAYFKGQWLNPFEANETKNAAFILETSKRDIIPVPTMHQYDSYFPIGVSEELMASVIELPYAGGDGNELAMFIVLPKQTDNYTLDEMLQRLTPENLKEAKDLVFRKQVALLSLPKFKLQKEFNLVPVLSEMGLKSLFDPLQANFSCLTPILKTSLSSADHKAVIEVNEEGTEAAAATAFLAFRSGRLDPIELRISHPFFYFIYHHDTDSILFMGVVRNPLSD